MSGKCKLKECAAPVTPCHEGCDDHTKCKYWVENFSEVTTSKEKSKRTIGKKDTLNWTGHPLSSEELSLVSTRSSPIFIGIVGASNAGKTTFLGMIYTLLLNGKILKAYDFAGTNTIIGWDELYYKLIIQKGTVAFPEPTLVSVNRLYHLALRNKSGIIKDVLFSDASGEVFSLWAQNRNDENAENARWIYSNCNAFILFIDCEALISNMSFAKKEIIDIAQQLSHNLMKRPVIAVWSKSDKKRAVHPQIRKSLKEKLKNIFVDYREINISNFLDPGPDRLIHKNNLKVIDWLMSSIDIPSPIEIALDEIITNDIFLDYKGHE